MSQDISAQPAKNKELKGWHVFLWMCGFFGIMFIANGIFLYSAITSFPGEDIKKSYLQGLDYNSALEARAAQEELGWRVAIGTDSDVLLIQFEDKAGAPAYPETVTALMRRLATTTDDVTLQLTSVGDGLYEANMGPLGKGQWEVNATALIEAGSDDVFTATKRIYLP